MLNSNLIPMNANFIPVNPNMMMEPIVEAAAPEAQEDVPAQEGVPDQVVPPGLEELVFNEDTKHTVNLIEMAMMIFIAFIAWLCIKA